MKGNNFFEMSTNELEVMLNNKKSELFNLRFQHATNKLTNPQVMVTCKRDIARIKTVLRQRELGISAEPTKVSRKKK